MDTAAEGIIALDPETTSPADYNNEACRILGYSREEFAQSRAADWEAPDAPQQFTLILKSLPSEEQIPFETRFRTRDGRIRDIRGTAQRIDGGIREWIGITFRDITDEQAAKERILQEVAAYRDLYDEVPVAGFTVSPAGTITAANRAGKALLAGEPDTFAGTPLKDIISPSEQDLFTATLSELAAAGSARGAIFMRAIPGKTPGRVRFDGTAIRNPDGSLSHYAVTLTDVSALVQERDAVRAAAGLTKGIIAGLRDGVLACTTELVLSEWNEAMEDITGIPAQDAIGRPLGEMLPFLGDGLPDSPAGRALAGEIGTVPDTLYEYRAARKAGWCRIVFSPLRDTNGSITGIAGTVQEVTARTQAARRIRAQNRLYTIGEGVRSAAAQARQLEAFLIETCRIAAESDAVGMAWIGLFDRGTNLLHPVAAAGDTGDLPKEGLGTDSPDTRAGPGAEAIRTGAPVVCGAAAGNTPAHDLPPACTQQGYRSLAAVPFRLNGEVVGVLILGSTEPDAFSEAETGQLALLGSILTQALDQLDKKTLRRRAGKGAHGSWERTRFLAGGIETAAVPFAAILTDGTTGAVNTALCHFLGYSEEELLALPFTGLFSEKDMADDTYRHVLATRVPEQFDAALRAKDGTILPVEVFFQAMTDETDGGQCVSVFLTDRSARAAQLTTLMQENDRSRTLLATCSAPVILVTARGQVLWENPAACTLLGQQGSGFSLAPENGGGDPRFVELVRTCSETGYAQGILRLIRGDHTPFDAEAAISRFGDGDGEPAYTLVLRETGPAGTPGSAQDGSPDPVPGFLDRLPLPVRRVLPGETGTFYNRAWLAFTGRTAAEEEGRGWMDGIYPGDRQAYDTAGAGSGPGGSCSVDYRLKSAAGTYRWVREIRCTGPETNDTTGGTTCICLDIDEQKKKELAAAEEKTRYAAAFERAGEGILFIEDDRITGSNPAVTKLLGIPQGVIAGHTLLDYSPHTQPGGTDSVHALQGHLSAAYAGEARVFSWIFLKPDGTTAETWITLAAVPLPGVRQACAVIEDCTKQVQAEKEIARLAAFPAMNPNPVFEVRHDRTFSYVNPATTSVLNSLGMLPDPSAFLPVDFDQVVSSGMTGTAPMRACRVVQIRERYFHESVCSVPGQTSVRIYAYDITDRVHATEALSYANHKLGILTSITRHDIQNKLSGVFGYLDLLKGSLRDPQLIGYLDKAEASAEAIRHHIDFTRDYESLGGTTPVWQEVAPILADVRSHLDLGEIAFEEPAPGFAVFADPMFAKVLYNLVDNSLRHGVHVRHIRVTCQPSDTRCLLAYEDDGAGIPQDKKEVIFERGFTTSSGPSRTSGLGLFLVRDILAITGITIHETGVPGEGSRFEIAIPPGKWRMAPSE
jgi:PAS domain S-box